MRFQLWRITMLVLILAIIAFVIWLIVRTAQGWREGRGGPHRRG